MIKSVKVTNHLGESIDLELMSPEKSGFVIADVQGLDPAKATINITELAGRDGAQINSSRVSSRNIVFTLIFLESKRASQTAGVSNSIEDIRQKSYKYFPIKKLVSIEITTDNRIAVTSGYVESNEINIFSKMQSTTISIICPDAYLYAKFKEYKSISSVQPMFEFPFENESLTVKMLEFGSIVIGGTTNLYYDGDADIGAVFKIHFLGLATNIKLYNNLTLEEMNIDTDRMEILTGAPISEGDDIIISTIKGNKFAILVRDGNFINILNCLDRDPVWFQITKGDNLFGYIAETNAENLQVTIEYQKAFEGI